MILMSSPCLAAIGLTASRIWAWGPAETPPVMVGAEAAPARAIAATPTRAAPTRPARALADRIFMMVRLPLLDELNAISGGDGALVDTSSDPFAQALDKLNQHDQHQNHSRHHLGQEALVTVADAQI